MSPTEDAPEVVIVGGGLAGLAAAVGFCLHGQRPTVLEARPYLGGRASSFVDPGTGQQLDNCQHVSMGCCTNLRRFCELTGIADGFQRETTLYFYGPDGRECRFRPSRWLPAPLHLAPALWSLTYLTRRERLGIAACLGRLARLRPNSETLRLSMQDWLAQQGQSPRMQELFWHVVLVSALSEDLPRISVARARQVFVEGFMTHHDAATVEVPSASLGELYDRRVRAWLQQRGACIETGVRIKRIASSTDHWQLTLADGSSRLAKRVILAVPWRHAHGLLDEPLAEQVPETRAAQDLAAAPITSVHLWFDRPILNRPHAVLAGQRLSQWVFGRGTIAAERLLPPADAAGDSRAVREAEASPPGRMLHAYQVVISASRMVKQLGRAETVEQVRAELGSIWPAAESAELAHWQLVTEAAAVFEPTAYGETLRPGQRTGQAGFYLAGDWTQTGWPATMEGAVRSGFLAAECLLDDLGAPTQLLAADLPTGWLARWVIAR